MAPVSIQWLTKTSTQYNYSSVQNTYSLFRVIHVIANHSTNSLEKTSFTTTLTRMMRHTKNGRGTCTFMDKTVHVIYLARE